MRWALICGAAAIASGGCDRPPPASPPAPVPVGKPLKQSAEVETNGKRAASSAPAGGASESSAAGDMAPPNGEPVATSIPAGTNPPGPPVAKQPTVSDTRQPTRAVPAQATLDIEAAKADPNFAKDLPDEPIPPAENGREYRSVSFSKLSGFLYDHFEVEASLEENPNKPVDLIPPEVRALNETPVAVRGFMMPIDINRENETRKFLLVRNRMACCFGAMTGLNEWIFVHMEAAPAKFVKDVPVVVYGKLEVGEDIKDGMVMSVYRMRGDEVGHSGGY